MSRAGSPHDAASICLVYACCGSHGVTLTRAETNINICEYLIIWVAFVNNNLQILVMYNSVVHACIESTYVMILNVDLLQECT